MFLTTWETGQGLTEEVLCFSLGGSPTSGCGAHIPISVSSYPWLPQPVMNVWSGYGQDLQVVTSTSPALESTFSTIFLPVIAALPSARIFARDMAYMKF